MYKWRCSSESTQLNVWQWRRGSIDWQAKLCKWRWSIAVLRRCAKMYNPTAAWTTCKETNANIEFKCYLVRVCVRLEVTTLSIGQKKSVINRLKPVNIAALLCLVTYRYAVVWLRTFLFVTFWPRNQHGLHETTFFFPELPETII